MPASAPILPQDQYKRGEAVCNPDFGQMRVIFGQISVAGREPRKLHPCVASPAVRCLGRTPPRILVLLISDAEALERRRHAIPGAVEMLRRPNGGGECAGGVHDTGEADFDGAPPGRCAAGRQVLANRRS